MISVDRVFHTSANLRQLFMVIIFIHNLKNSKSCKVIVLYLAAISQLMHLTNLAKLHILMITRQTQRKTVLKKLYMT